jgi:hypothetical protein
MEMALSLVWRAFPSTFLQAWLFTQTAEEALCMSLIISIHSGMQYYSNSLSETIR